MLLGLTWTEFASNAALVLAGALWLLRGAAAIKSVLPARAKPTFDKANIWFGFSDQSGAPLICTVEVGNAKGTKDCSLVRIEVTLKGGLCIGPQGRISWVKGPGLTRVPRTQLPIPIPSGQSTRATITGSRPGLIISESDHSLPAEVTVEFNTGKTATRKITAFLDAHIDYRPF